MLDGCLWISYVVLWIWVDFFGFFYVFLWIFVDFVGSSLDLVEVLWISFVSLCFFFRCWWISFVFSIVCFWMLLDFVGSFYGCLWISFVVLWMLMDFGLILVDFISFSIDFN